MTRVLHLLETANPESGGPMEAAFQLGIEWSRDGHRQDIVTLDAPDEGFIPHYPGNVTAIGPARGASLFNRFRYDPGVVPWLRAHAQDYDAVIVSSLWRYQARAAHTALAGLGTPYFVFPHGMLDPWFRKRYPLKHLAKQLSWWCAEGPLLRDATAVLFTNEEERRLADGCFWPYRVNAMVVPFGTGDVRGDHAMQSAAFEAAHPSLCGRRFILFLSRIHPKKGCDLLVEAFGAVAATQPELELVIAGPDQTELVPKLKARVAALGLCERVHFPGMLSGDVKYGAYRNAEAFILPSHQENFGIVVAEAMACGTPVLITDKVNIWHEVEADGAGIIGPDTVAGATSLLMRFLALDAAARGEMGTAARSSFLKRFHVTQAARDMMALIQRSIEGSTGAETPAIKRAGPDGGLE